MASKRRHVTAPGQGKGAQSISKPSLPEHAAPDEISESDAGLAEQPCFAPLPQPARDERSVVETGKREPWTPIARDTPHAHSERSRPASDRGAPPKQHPDRHSRTLLLVACAFVVGAGAGVGGTYVASADLSVQLIKRLPWMAAERENADHIVAGRSLRSDLPSGAMRSSVEKLSRDPDGQNQAERETDGQELSTLKKQVDRQLAEGRFDQPGGNNALDTYRQIVALAPHAPATLELGDRLKMKFWSLATQARAAEKWDDALHYLDILETLPAVPLAAISAKGDSGQGVPGVTRPGDVMPSPSGETEPPINGTDAGPSAAAAAPMPAGSTDSAVLRSVPSSRQDPSIEIAGSSEVAHGGPSVVSSHVAAAVAPEETRTLVSVAMARGDDAISHGDVISARSFYELAASNGLAQAATAVGRTYDPIFLRDRHVWGLLPDAEAAKRWYQKAINGGDAEASSRLERLLNEPSNAHH